LCCFLYKGELPSFSAPICCPLPKKSEAAVPAHHSTRSSHHGEKKKFRDSPEDDDGIEVLEEGPVITVPSTPMKYIAAKQI
jgi:hypothetical protein